MNTPKIGSHKVAKQIASFRPKFMAVPYSQVDYANPRGWKHKNETSREILANDDELPEGWSYLGHGASRIAFRGPDGVAYKRGYEMGGWHSRDRGSQHCQYEAETYPALAQKCASHGIHIPMCRWFKSLEVLAVELVEKGRDYTNTDDVDAKAHNVGLWDVHVGNFWIDKKDRLVCVDFA